MTIFQTALTFTLQEEGDYSNNPRDSGGATMKGITYKVYDVYRFKKGLSTQDVKKITDSEVADIYKQNYWEPSGCDQLIDSVALMLFDFSVNAGVARAVKILQSILASTVDPNIQVDGVFGGKTKQAVDHYINEYSEIGIVNTFGEARKDYYNRIVANNPKQTTFLKGWLARAERAKQHGLFIISKG